MDITHVLNKVDANHGADLKQTDEDLLTGIDHRQAEV